MITFKDFLENKKKNETPAEEPKPDENKEWIYFQKKY